MADNSTKKKIHTHNHTYRENKIDHTTQLNQTNSESYLSTLRKKIYYKVFYRFTKCEHGV